MTEYAASGQSVAGSAAVHHTLQRHRDILQDYRQEYNKTRANIQAVIEREDLLSSVHRDIDDYRFVYLMSLCLAVPLYMRTIKLRKNAK